MRHWKITFVIGLLATLITCFVQCMYKSGKKDPRGRLYAGAAVCRDCHQDIVTSFLHTNHYKTSGEVSYDQLEKLTRLSGDTVYYGDSIIVRIDKDRSRFFQTYMAGGKEVRSEQMDISFGSAEKAQTYAYWKGEQLFQLPLTFFAGRQSWTNSPGFPLQEPYFDRVILSRCLECHASYIHKTDIQTGPLQMTEKLSRPSLVFGIDCERCHGPAAMHVQFHKENPADKEAKFIVPISSLSRQQKLDLCASCHSGNDLDVQRTMFAFRPGDTLANFYYPHFGSGRPNPDVHGKQMQLLQSSKCFQQSKMTCMTCHDVHREQDKTHELFITKCIQCHQQSAHVLQMKTETKDCINCHMPLQPSKVVNFNKGQEKQSMPYLLRTHRIAVYPDDMPRDSSFHSAR